MYYRLKKGVLDKLISKGISEAGSIRKLAKLLDIPKTTVGYYQQEKRLPTKENLDKICSLLKINLDENQISEKFSTNWRQTTGGINCVRNKLVLGTLNVQLEAARRKLASSGKDFSAWHKRMKRDSPREYYMIQYNRFKKIGEYKYITKNGEKVRNLLEKDTADFFFEKNIKYEYEPLVSVGKRYFFPDFLIDNKIIIECTMWRGYDKAAKLAKKINILKKRYEVFVLIPVKLSKYYQKISKNLLFNCEQLEKVMFK